MSGLKSASGLMMASVCIFFRSPMSTKGCLGCFATRTGSVSPEPMACGCKPFVGSGGLSPISKDFQGCGCPVRRSPSRRFSGVTRMIKMNDFGKSFCVLTIVQRQWERAFAWLSTIFCFVYLSMGCLASCLSGFFIKIKSLIRFVFLSIWLRSHVYVCAHDHARVYPIDRQTDRQNHYFYYKIYIFQLVNIIEICLSRCLSAIGFCLSPLFFGGVLPKLNKKWGVY